MNAIKLLYVEDDTDHAGLIRMRLANEGFETVIAPTAAKAEKLFREYRPELVMVDLDLQQEKEGLEVRPRYTTPVPLVSGDRIQCPCGTRNRY
ncbi:MAG: hypothetical protein V8S95_04585 [Odoribacter sp.]